VFLEKIKYRAKISVSKIYSKSAVWWYTPAISATQETEAGGSYEHELKTNLGKRFTQKGIQNIASGKSEL
jgi:hypothetical protein